MSRVVARAALARGCATRAFTLQDLTDALEHDRDAQEIIYAELDQSGRVVHAGGACGALLAVRARLAPHVHARTALLELAGPGLDSQAPLALRLATDALPLQELRVWPDEPLLARLDMPFLTLKNIVGKNSYVCHKCSMEFEEPNPLKVHLFLSCGDFSPRAFWRLVVRRLATGGSGSGAGADATTVTGLLSAPARLEALAAEWGRAAGAVGAAGGHVCVYCGKLYSRKYGLKIHIRTHTGYKPLRCRHCARAFGDPSNLNKHVRLHLHRPLTQR